MNSHKKQILLSNDDGIDSPGLWAAAKELSKIGFVTVAAPREHCSAMGRGFGRNEDGKIEIRKVNVDGQEWQAYSVGGTPSQVVLHAIYEIMPVKPDLVVAGINYGENLASDLTYSGTVGAAIEAATLGYPAMASSFQILQEEWNTFFDLDFTVAAHFTRYFAEKMLNKQMPPDVDLLNVVIPHDATPETPWQLTTVAPGRYYSPYPVREGDWDSKGKFHAHINIAEDLSEDSDVFTVIRKKKVSVTPMSLNMTSRVDFLDFDSYLRE